MKVTKTTALLFALAGVVTTTQGAGAAAGRALALPVSAIEQALQAKGTVSDHVLSVEIDRDELGAA